MKRQFTRPLAILGKGSRPATLKKLSPSSLNCKRKDQGEPLKAKSSAPVSTQVFRSTKALHDSPRNSILSSDTSTIVPSSSKIPTLECDRTNLIRNPNLLALLKTEIALSSGESRLLFIAEALSPRIAIIQGSQNHRKPRLALVNLLSYGTHSRRIVSMDADIVV